MFIDLAILGYLILFGVFGYFSGALKQIFKLITLVLAYILAKPMAGLFYLKVAEGFKIPDQAAFFASTFISWIVLSIIFSIISSIIIRFLKNLGKGELSGVDSFAGLVVSLLKNLAITYVVLGIAASFNLVTFMKYKDGYDYSKKSIIYNFVENNNSVKNIFWIGYTSRLADFSLLPGVQNYVANDVEFAKIINKPEYSEAIKKNGKNIKNANNLMRDETTQKIIKDPDFQKYMMSEKISKLVEEEKIKKMSK
ncbi:CvpA family protein [bacterium]|nr:CvpA family protein [bacterium]